MSYVLRLNAETFPMKPQERAMLQAAGLEVREIEGFDPQEIIRHAPEADAVMIVSTYLKAEVIAHLHRCKIVSRLGTGTDKIDQAALTAKGIMLTNLPHFCTNEVADHTLALLLNTARQLDIYRQAMREGHQPHAVPHMHRLAACTAGIVGFGNIAQAIARRLKAFGMRVIVSDPFLNQAKAAELGVEPVSFEEVLRQSDYVCLMCPLTPTTRNLVGERELAMMKPNAVLVNTARGELIVETALADALKNGVIRFAALDVYGGINVFAPGGFPVTHPFFATPNLLMTPHVSAYSEEAMLESHTGGAQAVIDVLSGHWPQYLLNKEVKPWFAIQPPKEK